MNGHVEYGEGASVVGLGLAAIRDTLSFFRYAAADRAGTPNPLARALLVALDGLGGNRPPPRRPAAREPLVSVRGGVAAGRPAQGEEWCRSGDSNSGPTDYESINTALFYLSFLVYCRIINILSCMLLYGTRQNSISVVPGRCQRRKLMFY